MKLRVPINLASEPFESVRRVIVGSAAAAVLLLACLGLLITLSVMQRGQREEALRTISALESRLQTLTAEQSRLQGILRRPENAAVLERSVFLNSLLYAKGISWTRMFDDLEKVLPHNVRLVSIRPTVSAQNEVQLDMEVGSDSDEPVTRFLVQLENSPLFGITTLQNRTPPSQNEPLLRYRLSTAYRQSLDTPLEPRRAETEPRPAANGGPAMPPVAQPQPPLPQLAKPVLQTQQQPAPQPPPEEAEPVRPAPPKQLQTPMAPFQRRGGLPSRREEQ